MKGELLLAKREIWLFLARQKNNRNQIQVYRAAVLFKENVRYLVWTCWDPI